MPRIRTIKPEFWHDEKLAAICREARLLFIGLWNLSDDYGSVRSNPVWIKAQLFPYDDDLRVSAVKSWLDALVNARMLEPFEYRKEGFYNIRTFHSHQKVDRPSKPIVPVEEKKLLLGEHSTSTQRAVVEGSSLEVVSSNSKGEGGAREGLKPKTVAEVSAMLKADEIWIENIASIHRGKDLDQAIKEAYLHVAADQSRLLRAELADWKKVVNTWLSNQKIKTESPKTTTPPPRKKVATDDFVTKQLQNL